MVKAYGPQWDERVADEDAKRRPDGRKQRLSKSDLAVMLKVIQHKRIAPWWNSKTYTDPRIRSFASEILTLRNLFSHGNDCINEHVRLLDTASRLLQLLGLPGPGGLEPPDWAATKDPSDGLAIAVPGEPPIAIDLFDREVARLGESGKRLAEMLRRVNDLQLDLYGATLGADVSSVGHSEAADLFHSQQRIILHTIGAEVFDLLDETYRLQSDGEHDLTLIQVLVLLVRCQLFGPMLASVALAYTAVEIADSSDSAAAFELESELEPELESEERRRRRARPPAERWRSDCKLGDYYGQPRTDG